MNGRRDQQGEAAIGETRGMSNHAHDMVQELNVRLDSQWRYDQYIKNAQQVGHDEAARIFERLKRENQQAINDLRDHIVKMANDGSFR